MNALEQIEARLVELWGQRERVQAQGELEREAAAEAAAQKAEAQKALPALWEREAELWDKLGAAVDALAGAIADIDAVGAELRRAYGKPRYNVHKRLRHALMMEQQQRVMRARAGQGHNREVGRKARAAELRQVAKLQSKLARRTESTQYQAKERAKQTEAAVARLEGRTPQPEPEPEGMFIPPQVALRGR